jgi:hypothetical protein
MSSHDHDDGLVHSHGWAREPQPNGTARRQAQMTPRHPIHRPQDEPFDDGLVHSHGWACGERGRMAHR